MVPWQQQSDFDTSYLGNDPVQHLACFLSILQIESRHQTLTTREAAKPKEASDRAQPDRNRDAKVRTEGRGRRRERTGQRQLLLLLLKLLLKRCLRRWEQGKEASPEAMAATARRVANAASTAGIVSSPGARNALCLEIQLG